MKTHWDWNDCCRKSVSLAPAVGSSGRQLWRIKSVDGSPLVPGATVTIQNAARTACSGFMAAAGGRCGSQSVQLCGAENPAGSQWVLRAGPKPLSFMLESKASGGCPHRWLGAPRHCGGDALGMYARTDPRAALVWLVLPA